MRLRATPIYAWLDGRCAPPALAALTSALSYYRPGYRYTWLFRHGRWDGKDCLLYTPADAAGTSRLVFPAGLLPAVRPVLERYGAVEVDTTDDPRLPERAMPETLPDGTALYADQIIAGRSALKAQRGLLALATNAGKTLVAAGLCAAHPDRRCLILVNSRPLLTQTAERLDGLLGERVGRVGAGLRFMRDRVVVGMVQTLAARLRTPDVRRLLVETGVLIADEVHRVTPVTWFPVLAACPAPLRIGMSGTVKEGNLLLQQAFFGPVLAEVRDLDLVESGRSAEPVILMPAVQAAVPDGPDYGRVYQDGVVGNEERNRQIAQAALWGVRRGYRVVILYYRLDHGRGLAQRLRSAGIAVEVADGTMPPGAVEGAKRRILAREVQVLLASTIFNVGVDLPAVEMWVNAAAWRSPVASSQKLGRALRRKPEGTNRVVYVDPYDYGCGTLRKHADRRLAVYKRKGFAPRMGGLEELLEGVPP